MGRMWFTGVLGVISLVASLAPTHVAAARPEASGCSSVITLRTLHIEAVPSKKKVHPGDKFTVKVTVTRPAHEDPLGQGIEFEPPVSVPAAGVNVGLSVYVGEWTYFWDVGVTDEDGKETLDLEVPPHSELGWGLAVASARYWVNQTCPDIMEEGYSYYPKFVKVVP